MMTTELFRFLLVGGVNFIFTFCVFTAVLKISDGAYIVALILASLTGNVLTYTLNFIWVFRPETRLSYSGRFLKYLTAGSASIGLNLIALTVLVEVGGGDPFWSQVIIIPFIVVFNFLTAKFWSLRKERASR